MLSYLDTVPARDGQTDLLGYYAFSTMCSGALETMQFASVHVFVCSHSRDRIS